MNDILKICSNLEIVTFTQGAELLEEGRTTNLIYILIEGRLQIFKNTIPVAVITEPGAVVGEMSVLLDIPHTALVKAATEVKVYRIDNGADYFKSNAELSWYIAKVLAQRLNAATTYLADLTKQYSGSGNHLEMVSEVLESLMNQQEKKYTPGSLRDPEPYSDY
jgi:CRP/FNR family transcriptional regulator, cyclic AMP receptor protein